MSEFVKVAQKKDVPSDTGLCVEAGGKEIALYQLDGKIYALDNICPHAGGPMAEGGVNEGMAICPWHGWEFSIKTGECGFNAEIKQQTYEVKEDGEDIYVKV